MFLRCAVNDTPSQRVKWLDSAKLWYNSYYHSSLKCSPFKALYGVEPNLGTLTLAVTNDSTKATLSLQQRQDFLDMIKSHLAAAQNKMKFCRLAQSLLTVCLWEIKCLSSYSRSLRLLLLTGFAPNFLSSSLDPFRLWRRLGRWPIIYRCQTLWPYIQFSMCHSSRSLYPTILCMLIFVRQLFQVVLHMFLRSYWIAGWLGKGMLRWFMFLSNGLDCLLLCRPGRIIRC